MGEGDYVRFGGTVWQVVGFRPSGSAMSLVLRRNRVLREAAQNEVTVLTHGCPRETVPSSIDALSRMTDTTRYNTAGSMLCFPLREGGALTIVPLGRRAITEMVDVESPDILAGSLAYGFATRRPHLVPSDASLKIERLIRRRM